MGIQSQKQKVTIYVISRTINSKLSPYIIKLWTRQKIKVSKCANVLEKRDIKYYVKDTVSKS